MPYLRVWIHLVWTTKYRKPFLTKGIRHRVFWHIKNTARKKGICFIEVNGYDDHVHCLLSLRPDQSLAEVVHAVKGESSYWINKQKMTYERFSWQTEYYAASVGPGDFVKVRLYIQNQEQHHKKKSLVKELEANEEYWL